MDNAEMTKVMERMEANSRRQAIFSMIQCVFSVIAAVCCIAILVSVLRFVPQVEQIAEKADSLTTQAEEVLTNLQTVSQSLTDVIAEADLAGMVENVDTLVTSSQSAVEQATEKLESIDIESLNEAISDLSDVVGPLADWANRISIF